MSTDSDPSTDELEEAFPRVAELERRLREADIDLEDLPQEKGTTRRDLLKAAGVAGVAGLTGAGGMNAATQPASAGSSSAGNWGTKDNPGDFHSEDHFAVDQAAGGLTTPPTGFVNFGFESGTPKYVDAAGAYRDLTPFTDGDGDGVYTLPNAGDGIDVDDLSVSSAQVQARLDGSLVPVAPGLGVKDAIEPSNTTTPVQDALDAVANAGGGQVYLPPTRIQEAGTIIRHVGVGLHGIFPWSEVEVTDSAADIMVIDTAQSSYSSGTSQHYDTVGVRFFGQGIGTHTGRGLHINTDLRASEWRNVDWQDIGDGTVPIWDIDATVWENTFDGLIRFIDVDCGGTANAIVDVEGSAGGPPNGGSPEIVAYPRDTASAGNSRLFGDAGNGVMFSLHNVTLNLGGTIGEAWNTKAAPGGNSFVGCNWEPDSQNTVPAAIFLPRGPNSFRVGQVNVNPAGTGSVDYAYQLDSLPGYYDLAAPDGDGNLNLNKVNITADTTRAVIYRGVSGDVTDNSGVTMSPGVSCLGDLTLVT